MDRIVDIVLRPDLKGKEEYSLNIAWIMIHDRSASNFICPFFSLWPILKIMVPHFVAMLFPVQ